MTKTYDCIVVGAGASGLMASITAAKRGLEVFTVEMNTEPGKKLLKTGNGKCNFTHRNFTCADYPEECRSFISPALESFDYENTLDFFKDIGIFPEEKNGYLYPLSETALSVRNALRDEAIKLGVHIETSSELKKITPSFTVMFTSFTDKKNTEITAPSLIMATGSCASLNIPVNSGLETLKKLGVKINKPLPALVKLTSNERYIKKASGVRKISLIRLFINEKEIVSDIGEIQFTNDGISGIPVFQISRQASKALDKGRDVYAVLDLSPYTSESELEKYLKHAINEMKKRSLLNTWNGIIPAGLVKAIADKASISFEKKTEDISIDKHLEFIKLIKNFKVNISGTGGIQTAQVCTGGVCRQEINEKSLEHKKIKGLFFAGEVIDVDGPCGGYNLQWAWSSGYLAGTNVKGTK